VPYILSVSAVDRRKNLEHLIKCFAEVVGSGEASDLKLVLVGQLQRYSPIAGVLEDRPRLRDRVIFTGFVPNDDLAALYSGCIAFAFPSLAEGFGLPALEAMQCGAPVISSNTTSMPEVVGGAGILLDPRDFDGWCDALFRLTQSSDLRALMKANSLQNAKRFTWDRTIDLTVAAYKRVVSVQSSSPRSL
jgi:glycosyltransferase involved in cell wall biosynthesis